MTMKLSLFKNDTVFGFSLIELAVVLTVVGLTLGGLMSVMGPYLDSQSYDLTVKRQEKIAKALSIYAQAYFQLPCPADPNPSVEPFGAARQSTATGAVTTNACSGSVFQMSDFIGIVPFRILGLSEDDVKDGYGNFMTYEVAPVLTPNMSDGTSFVHAQCRTPAWFDPATATNRNPGKATFCCPRISNSAMTVSPTIYDNTSGGVSLLNGQYVWGSPPDYDSVNTLYTTNPVPATNQFLAYVLISHGKNGDRAFIKGSSSRRAVTANASAQESWNGYNTSLNNVWRPIALTNDTNYFDDILLWRTAAAVMSEFGNNSCTRP